MFQTVFKITKIESQARNNDLASTTVEGYSSDEIKAALSARLGVSDGAHAPRRPTRRPARTQRGPGRGRRELRDSDATPIAAALSVAT